MRVPLIGAGDRGDPFRPDLPDGASFTVVERHEDGTVTVEVSESYLAPARDVAARLAVVDKVKADTLSDEEVATIAPLFDPWRPGLTVAVGDVLSWNGTLVEAIQAHTTQADWTPDVVPALFKMHRTNPGDQYPDWVQPLSTNPYNATWDDGTGPVIVTHNGRLWENTHGNGNVWMPGQYGWTDIGPAS